MSLYKDEDERRRVRAELQARRNRRDKYAEEFLGKRSQTSCCLSDDLHRSWGKIRLGQTKAPIYK